MAAVVLLRARAPGTRRSRRGGRLGERHGAQAVFAHRARINALGRGRRWTAEMEQAVAARPSTPAVAVELDPLEGISSSL